MEQLKKQKNSYKRVNKDDLRSMLDAGQWSKDSERLVLKVRDYIVIEALQNGKHVIVDDTNLAPKHEETMRDIAKMYGAQLEVRWFDVDLDEAIKRDAQREKSVGEQVIRDMYKRWIQKDEPTPKYEWIPGGEPVVICDIDGTLALMSGRSPFDWSRVGEDDVNEPVANLLCDMAQLGHKIILLSGRDGSCREQTEQWLHKHKIPYYTLLMRAAGNNEKDSIIKRRLFDENIAGRYNVRFILDDRNQVVKMWREMGLPCFQVAEGNF